MSNPETRKRVHCAGRVLAVVGLILITAALIWVIIMPAYVIAHPDPHAPPLRLGLQW
jgi:drug/metabolite transporter superfamily protein YnfA